MPLVNTYSVKKIEPYWNPEKAEKIAIKLAPSLTLAAGTVLGRVTASNLWIANVDAAGDGSGVARAILGVDTATDASGNHFFGAQASSEVAAGDLSTWAWISGDFFCADLVGLDAAGLADMQGHLILGDNIADANAVIHIG